MNKITKLLIKHFQKHCRTHKVDEWVKKTVEKIIDCAKHNLGYSVYVCPKCGKLHYVRNTCKAKNCPICSFTATHHWLEQASDYLLPLPYQHIVFTLPMFVRSLFLTNFKLMTKIQFKAIAYALNKFAKTRGVQSYWIATFQFCGSLLNLHPHIHVIAACGGLSIDEQSLRTFCYYHAKTLSTNYTSFFLNSLRRHFLLNHLVMPKELEHITSIELYDQFIQTETQKIESLQKQNKPSPHLKFIKVHYPTMGDPAFKSWNVFAAKVNQVGAPFGYIVRYLHHPPISQHKIVSTKHQVTLRMPDPKTGLFATFKFSFDEFLSKLLLQFFPKNFHAVRRGGLLASRFTEKFALLKNIVLSQTPKDIVISTLFSIQSQLNKLFHPRKSSCSDCHTPLSWLANIPSNSYFFTLHPKNTSTFLSQLSDLAVCLLFPSLPLPLIFDSS